MHKCFPNAIRQRFLTKSDSSHQRMCGDVWGHMLQWRSNTPPILPLMSGKLRLGKPVVRQALIGILHLQALVWSPPQEWHPFSSTAFSCSFPGTLLDVSSWAHPFLHSVDSAQLTLSRLISTVIQRRASTVSISEFYQNASFLWKMIETLMQNCLKNWAKV